MAKRKGTVLIGTPSELADEPEPLRPTTAPDPEPAPDPNPDPDPDPDPDP